MKAAAWQPRFVLSSTLVNTLMKIEGLRSVAERMPLSPQAQIELRQRAQLRSTHFSTRIEGNRLTLAETAQVIQTARAFSGRERDVREVQHYWKALQWVEAQAGRKVTLTEDLIRKVHALVEHGGRARPTPYRDGQNVIRDSISRGIIYMPPEAKDVPQLMADWVRWVLHAEQDGVPAPVIAGLAHYQFVTIHPYFDGNGRTARLLATFILQRNGYGLNGLISLEEQHARDLERYYLALATHSHHNYYEGRDQVDITSWLEYFVDVLLAAFQATLSVMEQTSHAGEKTTNAPRLAYGASNDPRARTILRLFDRQSTITSADVAATLGLSVRMARLLLSDWVAEGWLVATEPSRKKRAYKRVA